MHSKIAQILGGGLFAQRYNFLMNFLRFFSPFVSFFLTLKF